jgi:anti-sigma factor RsiW
VNHLVDAQIQGLADGTLRGPEGFSAREHCDSCLECGSELALYGALSGQLSALLDPPPPMDFTSAVLSAVAVREAQLTSRRHTLLAAIPAAALAVVAIVGWGLSASAVHQLIESFAVARTILGVLSPVFAATRVYLGLGAFFFLALVLAALSRTLKPTYAAGS